MVSGTPEQSTISVYYTDTTPDTRLTTAVTSVTSTGYHSTQMTTLGTLPGLAGRAVDPTLGETLQAQHVAGAVSGFAMCVGVVLLFYVVHKRR